MPEWGKISKFEKWPAWCNSIRRAGILEYNPGMWFQQRPVGRKPRAKARWSPKFPTKFAKVMNSWYKYFSVVKFFYTISFLFKDFIYLFMRDTQKERQRHRQGEMQAPYEEPDVGLHPRTLGSWPEPKADA